MDVRGRERVASRVMAMFLSWMTRGMEAPFFETGENTRRHRGYSKRFFSEPLMSEVSMGHALDPAVYIGSAVAIRIYLCAVSRTESGPKVWPSPAYW